MLGHTRPRLLVAIGLMAFTSPGNASAWNYGCKGALPAFNDSETIIFNRGSLRDLLLRDASDDVVEFAKAVDVNSGLVPNMVFTLPGHPDQKLTLTEKSSKTISDVRRRAGNQPRFEQATVYTKVYHYVSDFGYYGPFDVKMDCINYELSAPLR